MKETIMLAGVHGVGKTYLLSQLEYSKFSASELIRKYQMSKTDINKRVKNINCNQDTLLHAIEQQGVLGKRYILDGHCCLLNNLGEIEPINKETFGKLQLGGVIVLTEEPKIICERLQCRDSLNLDIDVIEKFQQAEVECAQQISKELQIPCLLTGNDMENIKLFISNLWR